MAKDPDRGWSRRFSLDGRLELLREQARQLVAASRANAAEAERLVAEIARLESLARAGAA